MLTGPTLVLQPTYKLADCCLAVAVYCQQGAVSQTTALWAAIACAVVGLCQPAEVKLSIKKKHYALQPLSVLLMLYFFFFF